MVFHNLLDSRPFTIEQFFLQLFFNFWSSPARRPIFFSCYFCLKNAEKDLGPIFYHQTWNSSTQLTHNFSYAHVYAKAYAYSELTAGLIPLAPKLFAEVTRDIVEEVKSDVGKEDILCSTIFSDCFFESKS